MKTMTRTLIAACLMCIAAAALLPMARAADNSKISGSYSFTAHHLCADPVRVDGSYDEQVHIYYDQNGNPTRLAFTGKNLITYTNLTTGAVFRPNSSGPGTTDLASGQTVIRGGNGFVIDSNGVLIATDGRVVLDAAGNVVSLVGRATDVCARLGSSPG